MKYKRAQKNNVICCNLTDWLTDGWMDGQVDGQMDGPNDNGLMISMGQLSYTGNEIQ